MRSNALVIASRRYGKMVMAATISPRSLIALGSNSTFSDHRAMHGPIMRGYELGVPLLRFADHELHAIPLTMALDRWAPYTLDRCDRCDRCNEGFRAPCRMVMPRGASWVAVHVCFDWEVA